MHSKEDVVIGEVQLQGFQVIRGIYFTRSAMPTMTVWSTSIQFNPQAYEALSSCESVQILVNTDQKQIIVQPILSKDPDAVEWRKGMDIRKPSRISCALFTAQLFEMWGWNTNWRYRANGRLVKCEKKLMLMFDFTKPEVFDKTKAVKHDV